jgi:LEA14-like dessication related protein
MHIPKWQSTLVGSLFLLATLIFLNGCAALSGLKEEPKISIADIKIQDIKALEGVFLIKLRVLNPNDVSLDLRAVKCELEINGRHFASGITDSKLSVPAHGTQIIPVTVYASVLDIVASVVDLMHTAGTTVSKEKQLLPYTLRGTVGVSARGFEKEIPFTSTGELSLKGLALPR